MDDSIRFRVNTQNSIRISAEDQGIGIIYADPLKISGEPHDADYIFITHDHYDHFSSDDIYKITKNGTMLIVPRSMLDKAVSESGIFEENIIPVSPGDILELSHKLSFQAVPAYNLRKPFHPKGKGWCGYVLSFSGFPVYIAGDTDNLPENQGIECAAAFVPVGGTYTMNYKDAAKLVNKIKPLLAVPTHYGSIVGDLDDGLKFKELIDEGISVELLLDN